MDNRRDSTARQLWRKLLQQLFGAPVKVLGIVDVPWASTWDDALLCAGTRFAIEYKVRADTASVVAALETLRQRAKGLMQGAHPLLVVDHMGQAGRELCQRESVDWIDLSGNASITNLPRTRIFVQGNRPEAKPRGRKSNVFATKSSRVAHWLLLHQHQPQSQREILLGTGIDKGQLSRILSRLEESRLIRRDDAGLHLLKPDILLDAWRENYAPPCASIMKGVIPSRSGEETIRLVEAALRPTGIRHVFGGLSSAWLWGHYADFRLATCYLAEDLSEVIRDKLGFVETARGANVWFMQYTDEVAFLGSTKQQRVPVASPWFTNVDLSIHPERSSEAAVHLREHLLEYGGILGK